jgi:hypothetical protein
VNTGAGTSTITKLSGIAVEPSQSGEPEPVKEDEDVEAIKDEIVALSLEDLAVRREALSDAPARIRRRVIAKASEEILTGLVKRRLHLPEDGE